MNRIVVAVVAFVLIPCAAQSQTRDPLFIPAGPVIVGPGPGTILIADVNRDGHLDLVAQHLLGKRVTVRLGNGKGNFASAPASVMSLGFQPAATALGDVNGDGILDLAVARRDRDNEKVYIFLGNGRGAFDQRSGVTFTTSGTARFYKPTLRIVDVNEDGKLDVVSTNGRRNGLKILFGTGRGGFSAAAVDIPGPDSGRLYTVALGDVDGDGHLDVVAVSSGWSDSGPGSVITKRGDGHGSFTDAARSPVTVRAVPRLVALADVNGDAKADVVLAHGGSHLLSILLSEGNGVFTPAPGSPVNLGMDIWSAEVADVNADGKADLVVGTVNSTAKPYESRVAVLLGDGRGFVPATGSPFPVGHGAYYIAVGDVNEDGRLDIAAPSFEGDAIAMLFGRGSRR